MKKIISRKATKLSRRHFIVGSTVAAGGGLALGFHLPLGTVRDWEQGAHRPDKAAQVLLTIIAKDPEAAARALES